MLEIILFANTILVILLLYIALWKNTMTDNKKPHHTDNQTEQKQQKQQRNEVNRSPKVPSRPPVNELPNEDS